MKYSIITPTRNEAKFIEETIQSVISQTILPTEWIIMDDESTDNTYEIINKYLADHPFIKYRKLTSFRKEYKNRGGRVAAIINYADTLREEKVDILAKIDGDINFEKDFFSNMLAEFEKDPLLAVASGHMVENGIPEGIEDRNSGRGASLIIRYDVYLQIGKFVESKTRGEDDMAYIAARSFGWRTQTFDYYFNHMKPIGSRHSHIRNFYETGYYKGSIPYWFPFFLGTLVRDVFKRPYVLGALIIFVAYCISGFLARYRPFPSFSARQLKIEQKKKFKKMIGITSCALNGLIQLTAKFELEELIFMV
jgi:biofilm PGA synthesis N-glycosyltransferase PgaC